MWESGWRERIWSQLGEPWDLIVIGGGITGAGILREATRAGLRALLVELHDFASGTSSRSSKLIHGGFRYLKNGQVRLTFESVRERDRLLREGRGLVVPLGFLMASYRSDRLPPWLLGIGLTIYDLLALKWGHRYYETDSLCELCPPLNRSGLLGGFRYFDAQADDARLVLRVIREAVRQGGEALNYARVEGLCRTRSGQVNGVMLQDLGPGSKGRTAEVQARVVINATGAWADEIRALAGPSMERSLSPHLRKLRGSHLVFSRSQLPLARAVCIQHPADQRPVFAFPWEGVVIVGTTDVDQGAETPIDPSISPYETDYLLAWVGHAFPGLQITAADVRATFSGIRAVVDTGKADPSRESREHIIWHENGLLTVTGGKLTTFRRMAHAALLSARRSLSLSSGFSLRQPVLEEPPIESLKELDLDGSTRLRLLGRYGADTPQLILTAKKGDWEAISDSPALWAELSWAARSEGVVHLDDLLLRRVRLGLLLPGGAISFLERIRSTVQAELGWDDDRWELEASDYQRLWQTSYSIH